MNRFQIGDLRPGFSVNFDAEVSSDMVDRFMQLSGDVNPLHTDRAFARAQGFLDRVVFGMLTASFYSTLVGVHLPGRHALLQGVDASFVAPVFPGDRLTIVGEVAAVHAELGQIEIRAHITNQHGKKVSRAKIRSGFSAPAGDE
ncbi:MAG: MaoC/PaaZ C-terminal domain-containing protein [Rubrivivax sp.]|nr:MaoC/PaaZ C-terminal domain-containing protein [Rubrivivax sp.]MDP3085510.1 MaoC/PaaZ C-terminal domain-containing protein [Rubrivivax sp.]